MRRANPPSRREKPEAAKKILLGGVFPAGDMVKAAELHYTRIPQAYRCPRLRFSRRSAGGAAARDDPAV